MIKFTRQENAQKSGSVKRSKECVDEGCGTLGTCSLWALRKRFIPTLLRLCQQLESTVLIWSLRNEISADEGPLPTGRYKDQATVLSYGLAQQERSLPTRLECRPPKRIHEYTLFLRKLLNTCRHQLKRLSWEKFTPPLKGSWVGILNSDREFNNPPRMLQEPKRLSALGTKGLPPRQS